MNRSWLRGLGTSWLGIDLGSRWLKGVRASVEGESLRVEGVARAKRSSPDGELTPRDAEALAGVLDRQGMLGVPATVAAPPSLFFSALLELPAKAVGNVLDQLARMELARTFKKDPTGFEVAYWALPKAHNAGDSTHVLATGLDHSAANALLDTLEGAGLRVDAIDVAGPAIARASWSQLSPHSVAAVDILVDVGWSASTLGVMQGGVLVYERRVAELGVGAACRDLATRLSVDLDLAEQILIRFDPVHTPADSVESEARGPLMSLGAALSKEIGVSLDYALHRYPQAGRGRALLSGGGLDLPGLRAALPKQGPLELVTLDLGTLGAVETISGGTQSAFVCAAGLARSKDAATTAQEAA